MKPIKWTVIGISIYVFFYAMIPLLNIAYALGFLLFLIGNALFLYMVYEVLKNGKESNKKFDEGYWYSDVDKKYSDQ
ncbi:hypothetical protein [Fulvivirga lutea]|uniref:Uncharacterized protein n=1 Tax=Fulvivirga lutea TaxID=2810512 RepID=A0A974WG95_9BACT|nr:hypothetical protein [Fulvivirga lutea]QSE97073.1 hypothetical protein JR347_15985 [Fulvivirga lutea]